MSLSLATAQLPVLSCPICGKDMPETPLEGSGALARNCTPCRGFWFERGELSRWLNTPNDLPEFKLLIINAQKSHLTCPSCREPRMHQMPYSVEEPVPVDWCSKCRAVWINAGELTDVIRLGAQLRGENNPNRARLSVSPSLRWILGFGVALVGAYGIATWLAE